MPSPLPDVPLPAVRKAVPGPENAAFATMQPHGYFTRPFAGAPAHPEVADP